MQTKLAAFRRYEDISQKEMADLIGITREAYNNKELGKSQFKSTEMFLIARRLNKEIGQIFLPPDFINHEVDSGYKQSAE